MSTKTRKKNIKKDEDEKDKYHKKRKVEHHDKDKCIKIDKGIKSPGLEFAFTEGTYPVVASVKGHDLVGCTKGDNLDKIRSMPKHENPMTLQFRKATVDKSRPVAYCQRSTRSIPRRSKARSDLSEGQIILKTRQK